MMTAQITQRHGYPPILHNKRMEGADLILTVRTEHTDFTTNAPAEQGHTDQDYIVHNPTREQLDYWNGIDIGDLVNIHEIPAQ